MLVILPYLLSNITSNLMWWQPFILSIYHMSLSKTLACLKNIQIPGNIRGSHCSYPSEVNFSNKCTCHICTGMGVLYLMSFFAILSWVELCHHSQRASCTYLIRAVVRYHTMFKRHERCVIWSFDTLVVMFHITIQHTWVGVWLWIFKIVIRNCLKSFSCLRSTSTRD